MVDLKQEISRTTYPGRGIVIGLTADGKKAAEDAEALKADIVKEGNKAAAARARKATLQLEKLGKEYRKASIAAAKK